MATVMEISVVGKIIDMIMAPAVNSVGRQCSYMFYFKRNIQTLHDELVPLEANKVEVQNITDEAEWNLETVGSATKSWLKNVDEIKSKANEVLECASIVKIGCVKGWCPNLKQQYILSRKAVKLTAAIRELKIKGEKDSKFSYPARPRGTISLEASSSSTMNDGFKVFATREEMYTKIMDSLKDDDINLIGISGMGGVGKTTLVNKIFEEVRTKALFKEYAMVVVSQRYDLVKIQNEIGKWLGLKFTDVPEVERAKHLCERLQKGGRVLVVLDDVWDGINLREIGIHAGFGCKVLFTTRTEHACTEMEVQRHIVVQVLSHPEALYLFRETAGISVVNEDLNEISEKIARECGGLPIALLTLGKALLNADKYVWEDTLLQLRKSKQMHEKVQSCIMLSYNFLEGRRPQAQPLLLLCTLFQEDENILIEKLVKYSMGLELFNDVKSFEETRNRVHTLVNYLKSCNLLLKGDQKDDMHVKLHDVVRDVCLSIASNPPYEYLVELDLDMKQWPQNNGQKASTIIALTSDAMNELPSGLDYPNLRLLQLELGQRNINIDKEFFQGIRGLQILNIDGRRKMSICKNILLPLSLQLLTNLQTLSLEFCNLGGDVSSIGSLKRLKILSLFKCHLVKFPHEVWDLINLKFLDLRCKADSQNIENFLLSRLDQLEVLYMGENMISNSEDLNSLTCLTTLQICLSNSKILLDLEKSFFDKLKRFIISIGCENHFYGQYIITTNMCSIENDGDILFLHAKLQSLALRTQCLYLSNSPSIEILFNQQVSFVSVVDLVLHNLNNLTHVWKMGPGGIQGFGNLRTMKLEECSKLRYLMPYSVAKMLVNLRLLKVEQCHNIISIIEPEEDEEISCERESNKSIVFPQLQYVIFFALRKVTSFCSGKYSFEFPVLSVFNIYACPDMKILCAGVVIAPLLEKLNFVSDEEYDGDIVMP